MNKRQGKLKCNRHVRIGRSGKRHRVFVRLPPGVQQNYPRVLQRKIQQFSSHLGIVVIVLLLVLTEISAVNYYSTGKLTLLIDTHQLQMSFIEILTYLTNSSSGKTVF